MLSFNGSVHRLDWIEGSDIGAKFISHMPAEQKKPKTVAMERCVSPKAGISHDVEGPPSWRPFSWLKHDYIAVENHLSDP